MAAIPVPAGHVEIAADLKEVCVLDSKAVHRIDPQQHMVFLVARCVDLAQGCRNGAHGNLKAGA